MLVVTRRSRAVGTYEITLLATVLNLYSRLAVLVKDFERPRTKSGTPIERGTRGLTNAFDRAAPQRRLSYGQ